MCLASAYRTISMEAFYVLTGIIPIGVILVEDSECYQHKVANGQPSRVVRLTALMTKWQQKWDQKSKGTWSHRLILLYPNGLVERMGESTST